MVRAQAPGPVDPAVVEELRRQMEIVQLRFDAAATDEERDAIEREWLEAEERDMDEPSA